MAHVDAWNNYMERERNEDKKSTIPQLTLILHQISHCHSLLKVALLDA